MRRMSYVWVGLLLVGLLVPGLVSGGTTGKIAGTVKDADTGGALPGISVLIEGTRLGAMTDLTGYYAILNVPVGTYTLKALMVGYKTMEVKNVKVNLDMTTLVDFALEPTVVEIGEVITVTAKRPLILQDETATVRITDAEELVNLPTRGYEEVVGLQAGVTQFSENAGISIRGGRPATNTPMLSIRGGREDEVAYFVDGFLQQDLLTGISTTNINNNAIKQIVMQTGGFNAEYGRIMSGTVNVVTKSGASVYHGQIGAATDNFSGDWMNTNALDYNVYDASLGGPIIPGNDRFTFYFSGERRWQGDREPSTMSKGLYDLITEWGVPDSVVVGDTKVASRARSIAEPYKDGRLPHNSLGGWTWQGKMDFKLTPALNLKLGTLGSMDGWKEYSHASLFNQAHASRYEDKNNSAFAQFTHMLSPSTFYTLGGNYYMTSREAGDGAYWNDLRAYLRPDGNPGTDKEILFYSWDDINGPTDTKYYDMTAPDATAKDTLYHGLIKGKSDEGRVTQRYTYRQSSYTGLDLDLTSQVNPNHQIKAGFDLQRHTLRYYTNITRLLWRVLTKEGEDWKAFKDIEYYGFKKDVWKGPPAEQDDVKLHEPKHPITSSVYLQDKIEYQGVVINAGARYDYLHTGAKWLKSEDLPLGKYQNTETGQWFDDDQLNAEDETIGKYFHPADLEDAKDQHYFSPRLGIGFPITDRTVFHVSYGKFFQQPKLIRLYVDYDYLEYMVAVAPYFYYFGNPNLKPEKTTAYEVGFSHQLGESTRLDVTAYYKDVRDLIQLAAISSKPNGFSSFRNQDFGTIKGVDVSLKMRRTRHVTTNLDYSLSFATGTGSVETTAYKIAWTAGEVPKMTAPLSYDQRHKLTLNVDLRMGKGEGPGFGGRTPLERAGVNLVFTAGSGRPYAPMDVYNEVTLGAVFPTPIAPVNSAYGPWTYRVDMKADKTITLGGLDLNFYVWVLNLLDRKNVVDVFESSGRPNTTNWLTTPDGQKFVETHQDPDDSSGLTGAQKYQLAQENPGNYGTPRAVRFGMLVNF